jgi:hypothetical protein
VRKPLDKTAIAAEHFVPLCIFFFVRMIGILANEAQVVFGKMRVDKFPELWAIPVFVIQLVTDHFIRRGAFLFFVVICFIPPCTTRLSGKSENIFFRI